MPRGSYTFPLMSMFVLTIALSTSAAPISQNSAGHAATTADAPILRTEVEVSLVQIEARVEDRDHKHIAGLAVADFTVTEDGQPVVVQHVAEVVPGADRSPSGDNPSPEQTPPSATAAVGKEHEATTVIVVDTASSGPAAIARQRSYLKNFVRLLQGSHQRVALFVLRADGGFTMASGFGDPPATLASAIDDIHMGGSGGEDRRSKNGQLESLLEEKLNLCVRRSGGDRDMCFEAGFEGLLNRAGSFAEEERTRSTLALASLRSILQFSDHYPGRRSMVLISEGLDPGGASFFNTAAQLIQFNAQSQGTSGSAQWITRAQRDAALYVGEQSAFGKLVDEAVAVGVTVHWLNPAHSTGDSTFSVETSLGNYTAVGNMLSTPDPAEQMRDLAEETGGIALPRAAGIERFYDQVVDDVRRYYLLSYVPARKHHDGEVHNVRVEVRRKDTSVRARKRYLDLLPETRQVRALASALDFPDAFSDFALASRLTYMRVAPGRYEVTVRVAVPYADLAPHAGADGVQGRIRYGFVARDAAGNPVKFEQPLLNLNLPLVEFKKLVDSKALLDYRQKLELGVGDYALTAAVQDASTLRAASRRFVFSLPRADAGCLTVTPLMLAATTVKLDKQVVGLELDSRGDAIYGDRLLQFSSVVQLPASGQLNGVYQILNMKKTADGKPTGRLYFRLRRGATFVNQTPMTQLGRFTDPGDATMTSFFNVPYNGLQPGDYTLELLVQDEVSGCSAVGAADFRIIE